MGLYSKTQTFTSVSEEPVDGEMPVPTREGMERLAEMLGVFEVEKAARTATGSSNAAIIARELRGWGDSGSEGDFWVFKSYKRFAEECGFLTRDGAPAVGQVRRAVKKLLDAGLIQRDSRYYREGEWEYCYRLNLLAFLQIIEPEEAEDLPRELWHLVPKTTERAQNAAKRRTPRGTPCVENGTPCVGDGASHRHAETRQLTTEEKIEEKGQERTPLVSEVRPTGDSFTEVAFPTEGWSHDELPPPVDDEDAPPPPPNDEGELSPEQLFSRAVPPLRPNDKGEARMFSASESTRTAELSPVADSVPLSLPAPKEKEPPTTPPSRQDSPTDEVRLDKEVVMEPSRDFDTVKRIVAELDDEGLPTEEFPELVTARMYSRYRVPPSERREKQWRSDVMLILREDVGAGFETEVV